MLPFTDTEISPGRDFARYYIWQQMEDIISVKFGSFPIYIPAVSGSNFACVSAGYGQLYLPLPYLVSLLPGYWTGYAQDWLLLINLLTISMAHLALFIFLRRLQLNSLLAFALTTVTVYSPRFLMCVSFGSGSAAWAGFLFLCAALGLYFLNPTRIKGPLFIIGAAYWLINSGHPEEVYYCMFGVWIFAFLLPYVVEAVLPHKKRSLGGQIQFWCFWGVCCAFAFLLSSAYIVPLYVEAIQNMDFAKMPYQQSATTLDTLPGLIYNFFLPVRTGLYGCFGGTSMYLMVLLIPVIKIFRISVGRGAWLILLVLCLVFLYMAGDATPFFSTLWHFLPFASATRNPARAALIMPIVFMLALIWLFKNEKSVVVVLLKHRMVISVRALLSIAGIVMLIAGLILISLMSPRLSVHARLNALFIPAWVEPLIMVTGVVTLLLVTFQAMTLRFKTLMEVLLCVLICVHLVLVLRYGSFPFEQKHENDVLTLEKLVAQKQKTLKVIPEHLFLWEAAAHHAEIEQLENYFIEPYLGQVFRKYLLAEDRQDAYRILNQHRQRDEVVIEGYASGNHHDVINSDCENKKDRVRLDYSAYNRLIFEAEACQPAFFVLSYPDADNHWRAWVNGERVPIYSANGVSQAVHIPAGTSEIEFRYWSNAAFWGTLTSCLTLALIGILAALRCSVKPAGFAVAAAAICLAAGLFVLWFNSLYGGKSFNTIYTWESPTPKQLSNLAYGKPAEISARNRVHSAYLHPRRGVDGDRSFYSCCISAYHRDPWFKIDLEKASMVGSVVVTVSLQGYEEDKMILSFQENVAATAIDGIFVFKKIPVLFNNFPLIIAVSRDDENWEFARVDHITPDIPHTILFEEPAEIRYVKIMASGECRLCLNEVEVYPPVR